MTRPSAILDLLRDGDASSTAVLKQLASDAALLDEVHALARELGDVPQGLENLVLQRDTPGLVEAYRNAEDLEDGVWLLPQLRRCRVDYATPGRAALDALAERMRSQSTLLDPAQVARRLATDYGLIGNNIDYHDPDNSFMPQVLERRTGLPISLTVLWLLLCRRLNLEAWALTLPGHVYAAYGNGCMDLWSGARQVPRTELDVRARSKGVEDATPFLDPASDRDLLRRMAANVVVAYTRRNDALRVPIAQQMMG